MTGMKVRSNIDPHELSRLTLGFSGAQVELACREAGMICIKGAVRNHTPLESVVVEMDHFGKAIRLVAGARTESVSVSSTNKSNGNGDSEGLLIL